MRTDSEASILRSRAVEPRASTSRKTRGPARVLFASTALCTLGACYETSDVIAWDAAPSRDDAALPVSDASVSGRCEACISAPLSFTFTGGGVADRTYSITGCRGFRLEETSVDASTGSTTVLKECSQPTTSCADGATTPVELNTLLGSAEIQAALDSDAPVGMDRRSVDGSILVVHVGSRTLQIGDLRAQGQSPREAAVAALDLALRTFGSQERMRSCLSAFP